MCINSLPRYVLTHQYVFRLFGLAPAKQVGEEAWTRAGPKSRFAGDGFDEIWRHFGVITCKGFWGKRKVSLKIVIHGDR